MFFTIIGGLFLKTTKIIIAMLMVTTCVLSMMTFSPTTSGLPPANGNWVISAVETVTGGSYNVTNGNIIIQKGGTLTLDGAEILINDTSGNGGQQYFVEVQNGGTLIMKNKALIRSSMNASNYYWFYIRSGATASISYSNISDVGNNNNWAQEGIYINSNNVTIDHSNISRGYYGLIIDSVSPTISYNNIVNNDAYALDINSASPNIHHNQIIGNGKGGPWWQAWNGINIMNSKVTLENNNIRSNGWKNNAWGWGVFAQVSNVTMRNNTIQANGAGGIWFRTHVSGIVVDNTLTDNQDIGILIESVSSPSIINNNVRSPNRHSLQVDGMSTPLVKGNYFNTSNDAGVHFDGPSTVTMIGNDVKVWTNGDGIYANDGAVVNLINNTIYVENGDGITYWNWAQGTVSGNTVWAGPGNGITIMNWADVTVSSNKVNCSMDALSVWDWGKAEAHNNDLVSRNNRGMVSGWWTELQSSGGTITSFNEGISLGPNNVATIDDTIVASSNDNGVQIQGRSTLQMNDMTISSRISEGLYVIDSVVDVVNSSITAGGPDIRLGNSGQATPGLVRTLNTTFNESDTVFDNDNGRLNVSWFAEKIWAEWQNSMRVPNAALTITNIHDSIVFNGTLNANGEIAWLPIQEHNFTASKNNVTSYAGANVNKNVNIRIILQDLVNDPVLVISHPIDQGLYNTSLIEVNGTAQDPQSGIYQVTVVPQGRPQVIANGAEDWDKYVNLTDGQWTIQVNATNYAGVTTRDHVTITIDTVPPRSLSTQPK
jgi:parallel beta-helix repeat protein